MCRPGDRRSMRGDSLVIVDPFDIRLGGPDELISVLVHHRQLCTSAL